jgi:hypothetical protein
LRSPVSILLEKLAAPLGNSQWSFPTEWEEAAAKNTKEKQVTHEGSLFTENIDDIANDRPAWTRGTAPIYIKWSDIQGQYEISDQPIG